ncbi:MAG: hypothetical protein JWM80_6560 [Cyanobacteria bacterium RYN_339]|nr:hypothetical protein [Cyanobacteria bacterium RYN_339]
MPKPSWPTHLALAGTLVALGCQPQVSVVPGPTPGPTAYLAGTLHAPKAVITADGAGVLSNNGGSLVSQTKDGPALVSQTKDAPAFALLALGAADGQLRKAFLALSDRDERFYVNRATGLVFTATLDDGGRYTFPIEAGSGFPLGQDVVVTARLAGNARLEGYLAPELGANQLRIDVATTLCTELLRDAALRAGRLMSSYDRPAVAALMAATQQAIEAGDIAAVATRTASNGVVEAFSAFDLDAQHGDTLRNQYVVQLAAGPVGNAAVHALSDAWARLLGERPSAVTTTLAAPDVQRLAAALPAGPPTGGAIGTTRQVFFGDVAVSREGDAFVVNADPSGAGLANVIVVRADGRPALVDVPASTPAGLRPSFATSLAIEREPTATAAGTLLVATSFNGVLRLATAAGPPIERVAGLPLPNARPGVPPDPPDPADPTLIDHLPAEQPGAATDPRTSTWRLADEGERRYRSTGALVPNAARYAHLAGPHAVAVDELGNIYLADGQRIRMVPKADGSAFGYRQPLDADGDGVIDGFGPPTPLRAGCLYTVAGNPAWDPAKSAGTADHWQGDFGGDDGPAQAARLNNPGAIAFAGGYLYVADTGNGRIRRIARDTGRIESWVTGLSEPSGLAFDGQGRLFLAEERRGSVRVRGADGHLVAIAGRERGTAAEAHGGDGEARHWADLAPTRLAVDALGNVHLIEATNGRLRTIWRPWGGDLP